MKNYKDQRKEVVFFSLGGTWNTIEKKGRLEGGDFLGDEEFYKLEEKFGYFQENVNYTSLEWKFAQYFYNKIKNQLKEKKGIYQQLKFIPQLSTMIEGEAFVLCDFPSDYMRTSITIPLASLLLQYANENSNKPILVGMGTDTADITMVPLLDAYTFDTNLPPFIFTGSNKPYWQKNSDAPENFHNLVKVSLAPLSAGAYWVFAKTLFIGSDFIKTSPYELREIDNFSTYYSPHGTSQKIDEVVKSEIYSKKQILTKFHHISETTTMKSLYGAMTKVHIVDIGNQDELDYDVKKISDPNFRAVIVAGNSQGTVNNPLQYACAQAANNGKLVIITSRCLAGDVFEFYSYCVLNSNAYLKGKGKKIISGSKLNKNVAKALAVRAVEENLSQDQTQELFKKYALSRNLSEHDVFIV